MARLKIYYILLVKPVYSGGEYTDSLGNEPGIVGLWFNGCLAAVVRGRKPPSCNGGDVWASIGRRRQDRQ